MSRKIGTTASGKTIYDPSHPAYTSRHRMPKWNIVPSALDEPKILKRTLRGWTSNDHAEAAEAHDEVKDRLDTEHARAVTAAEKKYGDQGPLISAGLREHWPEKVKDKIRSLAHRATAHHDAAQAHLVATRFRS